MNNQWTEIYPIVFVDQSGKQRQFFDTEEFIKPTIRRSFFFPIKILFNYSTNS